MLDTGNIAQMKREIKAALADLPDSEYGAFMRELSAWAEEEANLAEYEPDYDIEEE